MAKLKGNFIGAWGFIIGIILAFAIGLFNSYLGADSQKIILGILVVLGILVGLLNIGGREKDKFLLTAAILVVVAYMGQGVLSIIPQIRDILGALLVLFVPAAIIVGLAIVRIVELSDFVKSLDNESVKLAALTIASDKNAVNKNNPKIFDFILL